MTPGPCCPQDGALPPGLTPASKSLSVLCDNLLEDSAQHTPQVEKAKNCSCRGTFQTQRGVLLCSSAHTQTQPYCVEYYHGYDLPFSLSLHVVEIQTAPFTYTNAWISARTPDAGCPLRSVSFIQPSSVLQRLVVSTGWSPLSFPIYRPFFRGCHAGIPHLNQGGIRFHHAFPVSTAFTAHVLNIMHGELRRGKHTLCAWRGRR